jgi:predicted DNA-binding protein
MSNEKLKYLSVRVPPAIKQRLDLESARTGQTLTKVLITAIEALPRVRIVVDEDSRERRLPNKI